MQIIIKTLRKLFNLEVDSSDQIEAVKLKIKHKEGFPSDQQTLFFAGRKLENSCSLASYSIQMNSTLHLVHMLNKGEQIFIECTAGKTISIVADGSDRIQSVKYRIQDKEGTPSVMQLLFYEGKELEDGRTLAYYHIQQDTTLQCVLNPSMRCDMEIYVKFLTGKTLIFDIDNFESVERSNLAFRTRKGFRL